MRLLSPVLSLFAAMAALVVVVVAVVTGTSLASAQGRQAGYQLIVNPSNGASAFDRDFVADAFLRKTTTWPGGETIRPADLQPQSPVRRAFSEEVLRRSVAEVKGYWQQRIFSGRDMPPPEARHGRRRREVRPQVRGRGGLRRAGRRPQGSARHRHPMKALHLSLRAKLMTAVGGGRRPATELLAHRKPSPGPVTVSLP